MTALTVKLSVLVKGSVFRFVKPRLVQCSLAIPTIQADDVVTNSNVAKAVCFATHFALPFLGDSSVLFLNSLSAQNVS